MSTLAGPESSRPTRAGALLVCAAVLAAGAPARAADAGRPQLVIRGGTEYTTGEYGTGVDTDILYVPVSAELSVASWSFGLTVPYLRITGNGEVVGGAGPPIVVGSGRSRKPPAAQAARTAESGLGDVLASVAYRVRPAPPWSVGLAGEVKVPTADVDKGLGTGAFDYTVKLDVAGKIGRLAPFGAVGYRFLGDDGFDLNDVLLLTLGASYELSPASQAGLVLDYVAASSATAEDALKLRPYLSTDISARWGLDLYAVVGLSDGSPDYGGGLRLGFRF